MSDYRLKKFPDSFFLTGFMATGKSTVGKKLATKLDRPFVDLDHLIVKAEGRTIKEIFDKEGEAYFRTREWEQLLDVTRNFKGVVGLGGGALHNQQVVDHLKLFGLLIFIKTPMEVIIERVLRNTKRPIVLDKNGKLKSYETLFTELNALYSKRIDYYSQAQIILESTGNETKDEQVARLIEKIKHYV